jgi:hypothetical protein
VEGYCDPMIWVHSDAVPRHSVSTLLKQTIPVCVLCLFLLLVHKGMT